MLNRRADKLELLRIAEAVALEKSIDKELIIESMETGIAKAAKSKFGVDNEIKVEINRDNGDIGIFRKLVIVENPENYNLEITLDDAIKLNKNLIQAYSNLGYAQFEMEDFDSATSSFLKAIKLNPKNAIARKNLSKIFLLNGNYKEGLKNYEYRKFSNYSWRNWLYWFGNF